MNPSYPIWSSGSSDAIAPQIYNWANVDRTEQANNIARRTQWDRDAADNARNYFQMARAQEAQDVERQRAAEAETFRRAAAQQELDRRRYEFEASKKYNEKALENERQRYIAANTARQGIASETAKQKEQAAIDGGISWLHENLGSGKEIGKTDEQLTQMTGLHAGDVSSIAGPYRQAYPDKMVAQLNSKVANIVAKTAPDKMNWEGIAGLKADLPVSVQPMVRWSPAERRFVRNDQQVPISPVAQMEQNSYSNPGTGPSYNFTQGTATAPSMTPTPAQAQLAPVIAPPAEVVPHSVANPLAPITPATASLLDAADAYARQEFQRTATPSSALPSNIKVVTTKAEYDKLEDNEPYIDGYGRPAKKQPKAKSKTIRDRVGEMFEGKPLPYHNSKRPAETNAPTNLDLNWFRKVRDEAAAAFMGK